jgi:D-alanine-D-alanine ligase
MPKKINIGLIFGGRSAEREVSMVSARNIAKAMDKKKYDVFFILIDNNGEWLSVDGQEFLEEKPFSSKKTVIPFTKNNKFYIKTENNEKNIDAVFPVLHGPFGEDGTMQGLLKLYNVPFVGPCVLSSASAMDKDVANRLLKEAGLPSAKFMVFKKKENNISFEKIKKNLGLPFFVKPANLGSSVGISKVKNKNKFKTAIEYAFDYDNKIIIEEYIKGKEIECSVLGNEDPIVSIPGEIIPTHDFYSYEAKYLDENGAKMAIPANISPTVAKKIQKLAIKTFKTLNCEGMARVDFFLKENGDIYINEVNTIPGFTSISMYPKLLEKSGISYPDLIDRLIDLAIERHEREKKLKISR